MHQTMLTPIFGNYDDRQAYLEVRLASFKYNIFQFTWSNKMPQRTTRGLS